MTRAGSLRLASQEAASRPRELLRTLCTIRGTRLRRLEGSWNPASLLTRPPGGRREG